ncbi:S-adenosylmethionine:tRNA ribosyltransferase-isomerase [Frankliniella fusca]|uniref:S-adenosylmethionine:tRNA ribosyltransferase-isomerase n=1 Tax=Frankliniella fusca TaxID=407009 RepID=A0AAE1LC29_9NEOP|nr:S-adenosylmethionine:tRNA ribosyltransferase-isomerase [Frankliniella fusca]
MFLCISSFSINTLKTESGSSVTPPYICEARQEVDHVYYPADAEPNMYASRLGALAAAQTGTVASGHWSLA